MLLVNDVETRVGNKCLRNADAFGCLVVFEDGSNDARQGEGGTVEGVAELHFLFCVAVAALEAVGLVSVEVADRGNFKPAALSLGIDFKVVADG